MALRLEPAHQAYPDPMTDNQANPEVAGLKGRRTTKPVIAPGGTALSQPMVHPPKGDPLPDGSVYATLAAKHPRVLFDPSDMPIVLEEGGHVPEATIGEHYVVSEFDAGETMVPAGCTTAITRTLWQKGHRVRTDAYAAYIAKYGKPGEVAVERATA